MIKKALATAFMVMAFAVVSFAQDINGNWKGTVMENIEVKYTFKVDGEKLTGTSTGPDGTAMPIKEGKVKGEDIEFTIDILDTPTKTKGKIKMDASDRTKDTVTLSFAVMGNDITLVLNRVPASK